MVNLPRPILAVHQPNFAPWIGWFVKAAVADRFVLLDDVQFPKASWVNRTQVLGPGGKELLTVPVKHPGLVPIVEVKIADPRWLEKHRRRLRDWYHGAPGLAMVEEVLAPEGLADLKGLADANEVLLRRLCLLLGAKAGMVRSSTLGIGAADPTDRHIALCRKLGARTYLSGQGAAAYNEEARFREAGIALAYLRFEQPLYDQGREPFTPGLSVLDLLLRAGPDARARFEAVAAGARLEPPPTGSPGG